MRLAGAGSSVASASQSSRTRRDFPTPGSPTIVTRCGSDCAAARRYVARRSSSSLSRPTKTRRRPLTPRGRIVRSARSTPYADHAARLALRLDRTRSRELESARGGRGCPLSGEHLARLGRLLESIGDVHGVTRDERASLTSRADDDLARVDSDAKLELAGEQLAHPLLHRERRVQRALGVILERGRRAEHRHHRVAGELLDRAAGELDLAAHRVVEPLELDSHALRIAIAGERGRPDEVGEQDGDELALFPGAHEAESCRASPPTRSGERDSRRYAENGRERLFPGAETVVELGVRGRQRAEHANAVPVDSGLEEQQPALQRLVDDGLDELRRGLLRGGVANELDRQHRAHPANVSDLRPARLPVEHARTDRVAEELRARDELLLLEDVEHGAARPRARRGCR